MKAMIAISKNVIGNGNGLPWKNKEDLSRFAMQTKDKNLVMGYNTFMSLPEIDGVKFAKLRPKIWLTKANGSRKVSANSEATDAILAADIVVIAPGDLYKSIGPALAVPGIGAALAKTSAKKVYIANLVNKPGQEDDFSVMDYCEEIERLAGTKFLDHVIYNVNQPSAELLERYAKQGELPVKIDIDGLKNGRYSSTGAKLLAGEIWQNPNKKDPIAAQRTLIRHDSDAVARAVMKIYFS